MSTSSRVAESKRNISGHRRADRPRVVRPAHGHMHKIATRKCKIIKKKDFGPKQYRASGMGRLVVDDILAGAMKAARRVEEKVPQRQLGPYSKFDWGMINGKLSALRWIFGDEWTCSTRRRLWRRGRYGRRREAKACASQAVRKDVQSDRPLHLRILPARIRDSISRFGSSELETKADEALAVRVAIAKICDHDYREEARTGGKVWS